MRKKSQPTMLSSEVNDVVFVRQPNVVSQAIYSVSTVSRRLIYMAMAVREISKDSELEVHFRITDFIKSFGITDGGESRETTKEAVKECLKSTITILLENGDLCGFTWFSRAYVSPTDDIIIIKFNPEIANMIDYFIKAYAKINLLDLGKLSSSYSLRYFEIARSYAGFAGKDGNRAGEWYFQLSLEDIRAKFCIEKDAYKRTSNFRMRVIDDPIKEINAKDIGMKITVEYLRKGRNLVAAKFHCKYTQAMEPSLFNENETSWERARRKEEEQQEQLMKKYPEEYKQYYNEKEIEVKKAQRFPISPTWIDVMAKMGAIKRLEDKYGAKNK
jgi:plasmid replication initiation protein